ncbi:hypothetical protein MMPV_009242 [Pyropia vietnamensis]
MSPVPASVTPGAVDRPSPMMVDRSSDAPVGGRGLLLPRRPLGIPPTTGTTASSPSPAVAAGVPTGARLPGPASEAPLTRRAVAPTGAASAWMPVPETQVVPLADLVAQGGTLEVGPIPDESDSTGVSPSGPSYGVSRVELDPSWRSELGRVIARPSDVRVEHHWILAQPPERHELLWKTRVARAITPVIPPRYGVCDLVAPSLPGEGDYPTAARAVAATCAPVRFGYPVAGTQRLPGLDYYAGEPPYLKVVPPFPPMSGMKTAASWRRNHGIIADAMRTDITSALQTGNGLAPPFTLLRPEGWQAGWETAPTFRFDTGPCLRYYGSVLSRYPLHAFQGIFTLEVTLGQVSAFLLSARRQGRLFHLPDGVRRHVTELGIEAVTEQSGLRTELEGLLAVHDAVNWVAVATLPPYQPAQGGHPPMPRHSLRIRRVSVGEDNCHGWASTESVAGLGIPVVPGDPAQAFTPWFAPVGPTGGRRHRPSDGEAGAREGPRAAPAYRGYPRRGGGAPSAASRVPLVGPSGVPPLSGGVAPASASPGPAGGGASSLVPAGGSTPWHTGLDARIYQHLGDAPGDAVVGTVHAFGELLGSIRWALDNVNSGRGTLLEFRERVAHAVDSDDLFRRWEATLTADTRAWTRSTPPGPSGGENLRWLWLFVGGWRR